MYKKEERNIKKGIKQKVSVVKIVEFLCLKTYYKFW